MCILMRWGLKHSISGFPLFMRLKLHAKTATIPVAIGLSKPTPRFCFSGFANDPLFLCEAWGSLFPFSKHEMVLTAPLASPPAAEADTALFSCLITCKCNGYGQVSVTSSSLLLLLFSSFSPFFFFSSFSSSSCFSFFLFLFFFSSCSLLLLLSPSLNDNAKYIVTVMKQTLLVGINGHSLSLLYFKK